MDLAEGGDVYYFMVGSLMSWSDNNCFFFFSMKKLITNKTL